MDKNYVSLQYDNNIDTFNIDNLLLIHNGIQNYQQFIYSSKDTFCIVYDINSSKEELIEVLQQKFTNIKRMGIIFNNSYINKLKPFLDNKPLFTQQDLQINLKFEYSENFKFIFDIINKFKIINLDFLSCNTLQFQHWKNYFNILQKKTSVIISASDNKTGNLKYGGDWILENTNTNIKEIYFDNSILNYSYLLDITSITQNSGFIYFKQDTNLDPIKYSIDNTIWNDITIWPVNITNTNTNYYLTIIFNTDIEFNTAIGNTNGYFILNSDNIIFDGNDKRILIQGILNYPGLINNGYGSNNGYSNITIKNLVVDKVDATLSRLNGWIGQQYFAKNITHGIINIINCSTNGDIPSNSGGILGSFSFYNSNDCILNVIKCSSSGNIGETGSYYNYGGIFGSNLGTGSYNIKIIALSCYSTGDIIGINCGGIYGG